MNGNRFGDLPAPDNLFDVYYAVQRLRRDIQLANQGTALRRGDWLMTPISVSPYYNNFNNDVVVPAAYLQPPVFDIRLPLAYLYGSVGMVVAHELTHAFDDNGRKRDAMGESNNWRTADAERAFLSRARCFERQYSDPRYKVQGAGGKMFSVSGTDTLGENIADNGGLTLAFLALHKRKASVDSGADSCAAPWLTEEQLFFYGFGQLWCTKTRLES